MIVEFVKYHGAGNDFVMVDNRTNQFRFAESMIQYLCSRHFGIGADGLIELRQTQSQADFEMVFYNPDGSKGMMCGNGGRCAVAFAHQLGICDDHPLFIVSGDLYSAMIEEGEGSSKDVCLKMRDSLLPQPFGDDLFLDTGAPHFVRFVDKEEASQISVYEQGREIRYRSTFQKQGGVNVNFVSEMEDDKLFVQTYERGVENETLACGTGVTASALCYAFLKQKKEGSIQVSTKGGELQVSFLETVDGFTSICLKGPAQEVFSGAIEL